MTEEEYFRKNYPDSCYGDKPLSPHWDFFQDGVEFGERQSEKKIEELEKETAELKTRVENQKSFLERIRAKFELGEIDRKEIEGYLESEQLTKAKDLLKQWVELYKPKLEGYPITPIQEQTEQFLSEVEK